MRTTPPRAAQATLHKAAFDFLLQQFALYADDPPDQRWQWLEAAHVMGQTSLPLHWRSHVAMLRYAITLRDGREALGQILRLALVPLGHALQRLPLGNTGRSHVSAFRPMLPEPGIGALIRMALSHVALNTPG
ncbi:DUF3703 domain-containing protein [Paracidovorax sp. MALMAid1276]|uniref:DUF3703 domain-containing protein n=1 Tax=Paracidovorax sp. MALMAid1276 TaxID=3411631 RepID=UPI003B993B9D